jgi:hypothetical protein
MGRVLDGRLEASQALEAASMTFWTHGMDGLTIYGMHDKQTFLKSILHASNDIVAIRTLHERAQGWSCQRSKFQGWR